MFGVAKCTLLALFAVCLTLALPQERNKRWTEPEFSMDVLQQGSPCATGAQFGDDIKINIKTFRQAGDDINQLFDLTKQLTFGDVLAPEMEEGMIGMCPGEIRRVSFTYASTPGSEGYTIYYDVTLLSLKQ